MLNFDNRVSGKMLVAATFALSLLVVSSSAFAIDAGGGAGGGGAGAGGGGSESGAGEAAFNQLIAPVHNPHISIPSLFGILFSEPCRTTMQKPDCR